jgi:hypothetical protein
MIAQQRPIPDHPHKWFGAIGNYLWYKNIRFVLKKITVLLFSWLWCTGRSRVLHNVHIR